MYLTPKNFKEEIPFNELELNMKVLNSQEEEKLIAFAMKKEQILHTHTSPIDATIIMLSGEITVDVEGKTYTLNEHEIFTIPATIPHSVKAKKDSQFIVVRL